MTPDNDIERVLDQWFAEGPMQMPGRFLDDTLGRIDREPKRRLVGLRPMVVHADPRRLAAAAAVVALLIAGIGSAVVLRTPAVGVNPSPSPSAGAFADPALLVGSWTSDGTRHVPFQNGSHTIDTIVRTDISIGETDLRWANVKTDVLSSKSVVGPDTIEFRMVSSSPPEWKCQVGDAGTYRFRISADGQRLTLTAVSDVCAVRQGVLAGEWLRTEMGDLAPGRHVPGLVEPFGNAGGRMSYTVPAGWNDTWECAECLILTSPLAAMISLDTDIEVSGALASCPPGGRSAAVIAAWLRTLPSLAVSTPTAVSIGGLSGVQVDVSVGDGSSTDPCPFLVDGTGNVTLQGLGVPDRQASVPGQGMTRWILLDRGDGSTMLIDIESEDKAAWDDLLARAMPVVDSFVFTSGSAPPTPSAASRVTDSALLRTKWTSASERSEPGLSVAGLSTPYPATVIFESSNVSLSGLKEDLSDSWSLVEPGRIEFRVLSTSTYWKCQAGDLGTYTVDLSGDAKTMTLARVDDACETRAAVLTGDWTRWPCPNPNSVCEPELAPGIHTSPFVPGDGPSDQSSPTTFLTTFSYTLPHGWGQIDNTTLGRPNDPYSMAILVIPDVAPHTQASDCRDGVEPGVDRTTVGLTHWLASLPGLVTSKPIPIEIGGYKGLSLDLAVAPTWMIPCQQFFSNPVRAVFTFADQVGPNLIREYLQDSAHARYIVLDVGGGHNLLIEVGAPDQATWDEFIQAAMPIVDSMRFVH